MIWCVEDDQSIRELEVYALQSAGFEAIGIENGLDAYQKLKTQQPELIVLDVMLPGMDGMELLRKIRQNPETRNIPVVMASAKGEEFDKVQGLDLGADYYLAKPFGMMEFISTLRAVLRNQNRQKPAVLEMDGIVLDPTSRIVKLDGETLDLTYKEFELLYTFMLHPMQVYSREQLFEMVWKQEYLGQSRTVDMHIKTLRAKLKDKRDLIQTVYHVGYRMVLPG